MRIQRLLPLALEQRGQFSGSKEQLQQISIEFLSHREEDDVLRILTKMGDDIHPSDPMWLTAVSRVAEVFFCCASTTVRVKVGF